TDGTIDIDDVTFSTCNCTQPGNGGAIAIVQEDDGKIIINNVQFTSCKTLNGTEVYGWGGAIFIKTSVAASSLTLDNFKLTDLVFSFDCSSIANAGHYIDIQSLDTADTGANIETKYLLTVNDTTNLYTNETYRILYMGIKTDDVNNGQNSPSKHCPLFTTCNIGEYYVKTGGNNQKGCFDSSINHCLNFDADKLKDTSNLNGDGKYIVYVVDSTTIPNKLEITQASTEFPRTFRNDGESSTAFRPIEYGTNGQFDINGGNVLFNYINFVIASNSGSMILIRTSTSQASLQNCQLSMGDLTSNSHQFIERVMGKLIINFLNTSTTEDISTVIDLITISAIEGDVSITSGTFGTTTYGISSTSSRVISASVGGSVAQQLEISSSSFTQCTNSNGNGGAMHLEIGSRGEIQLNGITMSGCQSKSGGAVYSTISGDGKLTIKDGCQFISCSSSGNGGAIYAVLNSGATGIFSITGTSSTFTSCTVSSESGLGGAIYLDLASGTETQYDLTGASYSTATDKLNNAQYGKNLFIKAANLRTAVPLSSQTKIGAGTDEYEEANPYNLMGYDGSNILAIPLYYIYSAVKNEIYHVNNAVESYTIGSGYNNTFCGHYGWPCLTIGYGLEQSSISNNRYIIGIISGYKLRSQLMLKIDSQVIKIQNSIDDSSKNPAVNSILLIEDQGKLSITAGSVSFDKITFSINENATAGYVITGESESIEIIMNYCQMIMRSGSATIQSGLIELSKGSLSINGLDVNDIRIQSKSMIKVNERAGNVNLESCSFKRLTRIGTNSKGGVIEAVIGSENG
ncbi:MAG: hypothetical protein EZS28_036289, partial [Streblomastix strix]